MRHEELLGQVQARARLPGPGEAERACRATLETLAERIPEGLAENLAAQLPHEIGEHLRRTVVFGGQGSGERFDAETFIGRVAERGGVDRPQAAYQARVVLEVADEATQGNVMERVRDSLPADVRSLVAAGSAGDGG
ncbi:MAG: DUF2267 domain-containing protein [Streptosporangiales bacterium]|nr:DUF2267 domain-containing protein [Streptosporangiales bacterium]